MKTFIIIWVIFPFISTDNPLLPYLGQTGTKKEKTFSERDSAIIFLNKLKIEKQSYYAPFIENIKFDSIYPIPNGLPKKDSIELVRGYDDLYEMKQLSKQHKKPKQ